ncbi:aminotransferase class V-fold PLP-dependent enzyme [Massilia sp. TWR1-2-2]|uniref:aminotransferase class V-fold PLP-dependent enzyme n=1 Tax=Massilia sp. TWR1-2-2 TaxID=2804584 RepID=UPI003CE85115
MNAAPAPVAADDETYWAAIRAQYAVAPDVINLENGFFGVQPIPVLRAFARHNELVNWEGSYFMRVRYPGRLARVVDALAAFAGVASDELLITRNLTEGFNILLQGYAFRAGDAVLLARHDYDSVVDTLAMLRARKAIELREVALPLDPASDAQIVDLYEQAITARTRVLLVTHLVHRSGQIMPVAAIAAMARRHGVDVMVDAAHSFAHLTYRIPDLGADFVCANLHKWLGAPLGVGLLYIRRGRVADIAPLFGDVSHAVSDIARLGNFGTVPPAPILAIEDALAFHQHIGTANIEARLRYLTQYWLGQVRQLPRVRVMTPSDPRRSCAIAAFNIEGMAAASVVERLLAQHRIFTVARTIGDEQAVRVTPHLYTTTAQLDLLVGAVRALAGAPAVPR